MKRFKVADMPRLLGIDYGEKRVGLALSDEGFNMAFPLEVIENNWKKIKDRIDELILTQDISEIVVGLPLGLKNQETESTKKARAFSKKLEEIFELPVLFENEAFSTAAVLKSRAASKEKRDASAAALILQSYLDRLNSINSSKK